MKREVKYIDVLEVYTFWTAGLMRHGESKFVWLMALWELPYASHYKCIIVVCFATHARTHTHILLTILQLIFPSKIQVYVSYSDWNWLHWLKREQNLFSLLRQFIPMRLNGLQFLPYVWEIAGWKHSIGHISDILFAAL